MCVKTSKHVHEIILQLSLRNLLSSLAFSFSSYFIYINVFFLLTFLPSGNKNDSRLSSEHAAFQVGPDRSHRKRFPSVFFHSHRDRRERFQKVLNGLECKSARRSSIFSQMVQSKVSRTQVLPSLFHYLHDANR